MICCSNTRRILARALHAGGRDVRECCALGWRGVSGGAEGESVNNEVSVPKVEGHRGGAHHISVDVPEIIDPEKILKELGRNTCTHPDHHQVLIVYIRLRFLHLKHPGKATHRLNRSHSQP